MKNIISAIFASSAILAAQAASAQTWTPATSPWVWEGAVTVQKGSSPAFPCRLTVEIVNPGTGSATTTQQPATRAGNTDGVQFNAGFIACPGIIPVTQPFDVTYNKDAAGNEWFNIYNLYVITPTPGDCAGDITGVVFNDNNPPSSGDDSLDVNATLPEVALGSGACTIVGNLPLFSPAGGVDIN